MICPRCNKEFTDPPALSRTGLGSICPRCGQVEAFEAFGMRADEIERMVDEIEEKVERVKALG